MTTENAALGVTLSTVATLARLKRAGTLQRALDDAGIPTSSAEQFWRINRVAILFWRGFVQAGGLVLDTALWHVDKGASAALAAAVELGLVNGWDGPRTASTFIHSAISFDVMAADIRLQVDDDHDFERHIHQWFVRELNRANCAAGVVGDVADIEDLKLLFE